jgi:gluconolactonase
MEDQLHYPNGVCLSPDQRMLYCCSNKPQEKTVLLYDADTLRFIKVAAIENGDGIKCDPYGNLYLCSNEGLLILDHQGKRLGKIELATVPANACWGGPEGADLLITARQNIFLIRGLLKLR